MIRNVGNRIQHIPLSEIEKYNKVDIYRHYNQKLNSSLCIPSMNHTYSLCIEYMKSWFLTKFDDKFFNTVYLDGKYIYDDFRKMTKDEMLKVIKPSVSITPQIDFNFNRDNIDLYTGGIELYMNKTFHKNTFFKDFIKHSFIGLTMELIQINFNFRLKISTKASAIDLLKYMQMAFRVGSTQSKYINMDVHIPYKLMLQVAQDCEFEIKDNKIVDVCGFLHYLNKRSQLPFLYKLRTVKGLYEFFIRLTDVYIHINVPEINCDDGEREGQLYSNFIIEMQSIVRFPAPKFYAYYSLCNHDMISIKDEKSNTSNTYKLELTKVPILNEYGWVQYRDADYRSLDRSHPFVVNFKSILEDYIIELVDHNKRLCISPAIFLQIKFYNNFKEIPITVDWSEYTFTANDIIEDDVSYIIIYADFEYINQQKTLLESYNKNRLE